MHTFIKTRKRLEKKEEKNNKKQVHSLALTLTITLTLYPNDLAKKLLRTTSLLYSLMYFSAMIYYECSTRRARVMNN